MTTRTKMSREELRAGMLKAARELIEEGGVAALTAREIAKRVGCALGTTYNIFKNLDDLIVEINGETLTDLLEALKVARAPELSSQEALVAFAGAYVDFTQAHSHRWLALFEHRLPPGQHLPDWYHRRLASLFDMVEQELHGLDLPPEICAQSARILWAGLHGLCSLGLTGKLSLIANQSVKELAERHVEVHLAGISG